MVLVELCVIVSTCACDVSSKSVRLCGICRVFCAKFNVYNSFLKSRENTVIVYSRRWVLEKWKMCWYFYEG